MYLICFAFGALAGVLFHDRRVVATIFPAAAVLLFIGLREHQFADWLNGLGWFFGSITCFEVGLAVFGIGGACLRRAFEAHKHGIPKRPSVSRVN
jgi:hypothetical protein